MIILSSYINSTSDILSESLIGISIVFSALALLVLAFNLSAKINKDIAQKRTIKAIGDTGTPQEQLDSEQTAAIFMALHLYMNENKHDEESNVITIKRIQKRYSPWNSKIYSMNNFQ